MNAGLTSEEMKQFKELLIKANNEQITAMFREIITEDNKRIGLK